MPTVEPSSLSVVQRTFLEVQKKERRKKIPQEAKDAVVEIKRKHNSIHLGKLVNLIKKRLNVNVSISHACKILNDAGIRDETRRRRLESEETQVLYDRPPFNPLKTIRCLSCRGKYYESVDWPEHCFRCARAHGKSKEPGDKLEIQEELFS